MPGYCWSPNKTHTTCGSITADKGVSSIHTITVYKEQKHRNTYTHWKIIATRHSSLLLLVTRPQMLDTSFQELDLDFVHTNTHTKCMCARTPPTPHTPSPHTLCVEIVEGKNEYWRYMYARLSTKNENGEVQHLILNSRKRLSLQLSEVLSSHRKGKMQFTHHVTDWSIKCRRQLGN